MLKLKSLVVLLTVCLCAPIFALEQLDSKNFIEQTHHVDSEILGQKRTVKVSLPTSYRSSENKYPVIILLDSEHFFDVTSALVHSMSARGPMMPEAIVVGVNNVKGQRTKDFTPTKVKALPGETLPSWMTDSGGSKEFRKFLEEELLGWLDTNYRATKFRTLIGYSLGGAFALNGVVQQTSKFNNVIAIDPWLGWDNQTINKSLEEQINKVTLAKSLVYIASANSAPKDSINQFITTLKKSTHWQEAITVIRTHFAEETHRTVPLAALYDGLKTTFSYTVMSQSEALKDPDTIYNYFERSSSILNTKIRPSEQYFNLLGSIALIREKNPIKAVQLFEAYVNYYPESSNARVSLGEAYVTAGQAEKAILSFKQAIVLDENNSNAIKRLEEVTH